MKALCGLYNSLIRRCTLASEMLSYLMQKSMCQDLASSQWESRHPVLQVQTHKHYPQIHAPETESFPSWAFR